MRLTLFLAALALVSGCQSAAAERAVYHDSPAAAGIVAAKPASEDAAYYNDDVRGRADNLFAVPVSEGSAAALSPDTQPERLLVYSGRFSVAVGNVEKAQEEARAMAEELGGYFQSLTGDQITLRVPADRWEDAVARVSDLGRVLDRAIQAADVTEEVVDLRLGLRNAEALNKRLEELLAKAETVEAALKVETELARVRAEIERIEGRLAWLADRVAYSTLTIRFVKAEAAATRPQALPFRWLAELSLENLLGLRGGVR